MINKLKLVNFRNFKANTLEFSPQITVMIGPNASGKTNILESLFLLSTGKSFKARIESEMLRYEQELARVVGVLLGAGPVGSSSRSTFLADAAGAQRDSLRSRHPQFTLEAVITRGENGWPRKKLLVNGVPKRLIDFAGNFRTVLFGPWDLDLVTESPSLRRKFLDTVLPQVDREYRRSVLSYEKGLRQRNRLLFRIREEGVPRGQLLFWNQLLIRAGDYISARREEFIEFVNNTNSLINTNKYKYPINTNNYQLEYDKSVISEGRLEQYKEEEIAAATTLVGPHRDDFIFLKGNTGNRSSTSNIGRKLDAFGSRGEQRMAILWLKMAELDYIENAGTETSSVRPTLLLDDIFSELDHEHREIAMEVAKKQQTIITTADEHFLKGLKPGGTIKLQI